MINTQFELFVTECKRSINTSLEQFEDFGPKKSLKEGLYCSHKKYCFVLN